MTKEHLILGIETSCDDTSLAILRASGQRLPKPELLASETFSQEKMLAKWGGVVPELAARNHLEKLAPLLKEVLQSAKIKTNQLTGIGVTTVPGLLGPLLTGINVAKSLSLIHKIPLIPVNHLFAHLEAIFLTEEVAYPYLGLLVSGGHSAFFLVRGPNQFELIGSTIDDAAGEAFDKAGKMLGLGYPAGRIIDHLANQFTQSMAKSPTKIDSPTLENSFSFPIGLRHSGDANLSYSGLKTSLRVFLEKNPEQVIQGKIEDLNSEQLRMLQELCYFYQNAIVESLFQKLLIAEQMALQKIGMPAPSRKGAKSKNKIPIVVGGGVAANQGLREKLLQNFDLCHFVKPSFCTDNGAMIANWSYRNIDLAIPFPQCLDLDAKSSFISKGAM